MKTVEELHGTSDSPRVTAQKLAKSSDISVPTALTRNQNNHPEPAEGLPLQAFSVNGA